MQHIALYSIGQLAELSTTKVATIRFYEQSGLMLEPPRTAGGQRRYGPAHLERLQFIRHARALGFSISDIHELLRLAAHPEAPCHSADELAAKHLREVDGKIAQLQALKTELEHMLAACCSGGVLKDCRIIEAISVPLSLGST